MNDLPRHTLTRIIAKHGRDICASPKRVEAMLRDLCGAHRREINIIMGALEERVATDLNAAGNSSVPRDVLFARLAARLRDNLAYTPEAARWGVEAWAVALGVLSEAELQGREAQESPDVGRSTAAAPTPVRDNEPLGESAANVKPQATRPRGETTAPPAQQTAPKASPPPGFRPTAPRRGPLPPPSVNVPEPPGQSISLPLPSPRAPRRGPTLRGCVIGAVLIILLIVAAVFIVPAVIMILREEQATPSINEPRIR